jgi:hypothetical protein
MEETQARNDRGLFPRSKRGPLQEQIPGEEGEMTKFQTCGGALRYSGEIATTGGW